MAQVEKVVDVEESVSGPLPQDNKSVARLLKENPYVAGVAVVSQSMRVLPLELLAYSLLRSSLPWAAFSLATTKV